MKNRSNKLMQFSWHCYALDPSTQVFLENSISKERANLADSYRQSREKIEETCVPIKNAIIFAKKNRLKNTEILWNAILFVMQRDKDLKLVCERMIESDDATKIERASIDACVLIFETLRKFEVIAGFRFNIAVKKLGISDEMIEPFDEIKKLINKFANQHMKSLKVVRDNAGAHLDGDCLYYDRISKSIPKQETISMIIEFEKLINKLAAPLKPMMEITSGNIQNIEEGNR